ncbi:hypothetical protein ACWDAG_24520 [Streptomyces sp. NPDC001157]
MKLLEEQVGAVTGRGPEHPTDPNRELQSELDRFIGEHPSIAEDEGYVGFLMKYAGAYAENSDATRIVDIFGFGGTSTDIVDPDFPLVDENGFLVFAQCIYSEVADGELVDSYEHDFAFSVAGDRPPGVYRADSTLRESEQPFIRYADDFCEWLQRLIEVRGRFERPKLA